MNPAPLDLELAAADPLVLTLDAGTVTASASARTISGVALVYGKRADASTGAVLFEPGSLTWHAAVGRVKLLMDHDKTRPVGYATELAVTGDELRATFHVPPGPDGDLALTQAASGLRDGLSVGAIAERYTFDDDGTARVTAATLREITLTAVPALDDARVSRVAAHASTAHPPRKDHPMDPETTAPGTPAAPPAAPAVELSTPAAPVQLAAPAAPVQLPAPAAPITTAPRAMVTTLAAAARLISDTIRAGGSAADVRSALTVQAALADVIPADDLGTGLVQRAGWLGEVWQASQTRRPFIDALGTPKPLTTVTVDGWAWDVRPQVVDYPGNKTAVTGNAVKTKPVTATAERVAGGWDVDRIYIDLGQPGMIEALFDAAVMDYRIKSEAKVTAQLLTAASSVTAQTTLAGALAAVGSAAARLGATVSAVGFGSAVWGDFVELGRDAVPWWMGSGDSVSLGTETGRVGGMDLFVHPDLGATDVLAVDSRAATFHEVYPPVRVQALDIANGGVDLGVFGYQALVINDSRAIVKTTVTPPAP